MAIDPFTYGGTHAGEILADRLNELDDQQLTRKVSSFLHTSFSGFSALSAIEDDALWERFIVLWRNDRTAKVNYGHGLDTFMRSIIVACSREWLRGEQDRG